MPLNPPKKILAIKLRALGDTVLMTAPLAELRSAYPGAEIHALVQVPWTALLENHPSVDRVWSYERRTEPAARAKALASLAIKLRRERFDCVVNFHASPSSALLAFATGARTRSVHFHGHRDKNRYSTVPIPGKGILKPVIERDMDVLRALGIAIPPGKIPHVELLEVEVTAARRRLEQAGVSGPVLAIGLGASRPTKCWPLDRFARVALDWRRATGGGVMAVVSPGEEEAAHSFLKSFDDLLTSEEAGAPARAALRSGLLLEQDLSLRALAAALSVSDVYLGNDSGPKHLAVAVGAPTVTLFGPEDPFEWHPYPKDRHPYFFIENLPCRKDAQPGMPPWCSLHECVIEQHKCMRWIGVDAVMAECKRLLKTRSAV